MALNGLNSKLLVVLPGDDGDVPIVIPLPLETMPSELYHSTIMGSVIPSGNNTEQTILYGWPATGVPSSAAETTISSKGTVIVHVIMRMPISIHIIVHLTLCYDLDCLLLNTIR